MGLAAAAAGVALPRLVFAQEAPVTPAPTPVPAPAAPKLTVTSVIGTNHGHDLMLTPEEVVRLLRFTKNAPPAILDIKGRSNHPHAVELTHEDLLAVLVDGTVKKESTRVGNHTHAVEVKLEIVKPEALGGA